MIYFIQYHFTIDENSNMLFLRHFVVPLKSFEYLTLTSQYCLSLRPSFFGFDLCW